MPSKTLERYCYEDLFAFIQGSQNNYTDLIVVPYIKARVAPTLDKQL